MRYKFLRFPEGKLKALTLSYDDGVRADIRLAEIINAYGIKCTFNINSGNLPTSANPNKLSADEIREHLINTGHEVAVHGKHHMAPGIANSTLAIKDILDCRIEMENTFGMIVRGLAYPDSGITKIHTGNSYETIRGYLKDLGIIYARTLAGDNNSFALPSDFYAWMPTAHHANPNLMKWAEEFVSISEKDLYLTRAYPRLFYLWGHSYEFNNNDNWNVIEDFCKTVAGKDDIWYATNIEIYEYIEAYNSLVTSADGRRIYNPTLKEVYMFIDGKTLSVKPGETIFVN